MRKHIIILAILGLLGGPLGVVGQAVEETRPAQITFISPLGTNGLESPQIVNQLSLNILAGVSAGVEGIEVGGLVNANRHFMEGVQVAGLVNVVGGEVQGVQAAGFANVTQGPLEAVQLAGFLNVNGSSLEGLQFSGFGNVLEGNFEGGQFAGFLNVSGGRGEGLQMAGFLNVNGGSLEGIQGAGFANVAGGTISGLQASGFLNTVEKIEGVQAAGFLNVAKNVRGGQFSGFLNVAKTVQGIQIGIVNVADSVDGVSIGVLSLVKNGLNQIEVSGGEALHTQVAVKLGTRQFYNIFAVGMHFGEANFDSEENYYAFGYGVGTQLGGVRGLVSNLELMCFQLNEGLDEWNGRLNLLNQLKYTLAWQPAKRFAIYAGPTLNLTVEDHGPNREFNDPGVAPGYAVERFSRNDNTRFQFWPGFNAGVRF